MKIIKEKDLNDEENQFFNLLNKSKYREAIIYFKNKQLPIVDYIYAKPEHLINPIMYIHSPNINIQDYSELFNFFSPSLYKVNYSEKEHEELKKEYRFTSISTPYEMLLSSYYYIVSYPMYRQIEYELINSNISSIFKHLNSKSIFIEDEIKFTYYIRNIFYMNKEDERHAIFYNFLIRNLNIKDNNFWYMILNKLQVFVDNKSIEEELIRTKIKDINILEMHKIELSNYLINIINKGEINKFIDLIKDKDIIYSLNEELLLLSKNFLSTNLKKDRNLIKKAIVIILEKGIDLKEKKEDGYEDINYEILLKKLTISNYDKIRMQTKREELKNIYDEHFPFLEGRIIKNNIKLNSNNNIKKKRL